MTREQEPDTLPLWRIALPVVIVVAVATAATAGAGVAATRGAGAPVAKPAGTINRALFPTEALTQTRDVSSRLDRYRWVDRDAGLAEIPIVRAIDIVLDGSP